MGLVVSRSHPVPLDGLAALPEELDGSQGDNRLPPSHCQIRADNDWQAIQCWLAEFEDSPDSLMIILTADGQMSGQKLEIGATYRVQSQFRRRYSVMAVSKKEK